MLNLYFKGSKKYNEDAVVHNAEDCFAKCKLTLSDKEKKMVEVIENGRLIDQNSFIDRFGYKLPTNLLSTGCKAALCVLCLQDNVIDLVECGDNAIEAIIKYCDSGSVLMDDFSITFPDNGEKINVNANGVKLHTMAEYNSFVGGELF